MLWYWKLRGLRVGLGYPSNLGSLDGISIHAEGLWATGAAVIIVSLVVFAVRRRKAHLGLNANVSLAGR